MNSSYILNRVPSKYVPFTSYEVWKGATPNLNVMRGVRLMFIMFLMNMGSLVLRGRNVSS